MRILRIEKIIKEENPDAYKKLKNIENKIELGDSVENLMKADSYRRVKGALRQTKRG